jgi:hypothetical protein
MASDETPSDFLPGVHTPQTSWCAPSCRSKLCLAYLRLPSVISLVPTQCLKDISNSGAEHLPSKSGSSPALPEKKGKIISEG